MWGFDFFPFTQHRSLDIPTCINPLCNEPSALVFVDFGFNIIMLCFVLQQFFPAMQAAGNTLFPEFWKQSIRNPEVKKYNTHI